MTATSKDVDAVASADLSVAIDGHEVTALVDTGASYSIVSQRFADRLRKVKTPWDGPQIRTAGGHLMTPAGKCTAKVRIGDGDYVATFVILPQCCKDVILGMDFLQEYDAVINIRDQFVSFSANESAPGRSEQRSVPLRIIGDTSVPPRSCVLVSVKCDGIFSGDGIAEIMGQLLLEHGIAIARGLVNIKCGATEVLLTNFSNQRREIAAGTTVAVYEDVPDAKNCFALQSDPMQSDPTSKTTCTFSIDVNGSLPQSEREQLFDLLHHFGDCFSSTSRVRQTPLTKHRIVTDEAERPVYQHPYRVSPKERDAIRRQVQEMLADNVIQPSKSPWASPVVLV